MWGAIVSWLVIMVLAATFLWRGWQNELTSRSPQSVARLDAQLWLRDNVPASSLVVIPEDSWRTMSQRQKLNPFARVTAAYVATRQAQAHREQLLGFYGISAEAARGLGASELSRLQRDIFGGFGENDFLRFASEFGATHLVLPSHNEYTDRTQLGLPLIYENQYYHIYELEPLSPLECTQYVEQGEDDVGILKPCLLVLTESGYFDRMHGGYSGLLEIHPISFVWQGPETVSIKDLSQTVWPFALQGHRGDFVFSRISGEGGDVIRVSPGADQESGNEMLIQFGVSFEDRGEGLEITRESPRDEGDGLEIQPGQVVILSVWVRMSASPERADIFIQDRTEAWDRSRTSVSGASTAWQRYLVLRTIRDGAGTAGLGLLWAPKTGGEWLEVRDMRVLVYPFQSASQP